jgi:hypothetical protein
MLAQSMGADGLETRRFQFASPAAWWRARSGLLSKYELIVEIYGAWHIWKERYRRVF